MTRLFCIALLALGMGCAALGPTLATPDDLEDYRAFRVAAAAGTRLARAKAYVARHPQGRFAEEVTAAFDDEEPRYWEDAQRSREGLRRYIADLPEGPHAAAAHALLIAYRSSIEEAALEDLARKVRIGEARLEAAAVQRRAVGEGVLGAVGVFLDEGVYGVRHDELPASARALLLGRGSPTWGAVPRTHEEDYFFILPTRPERESRLLTLEIAVVEEDGVVIGGNVEGTDMFVRWTEADQIVRLDSDLDDDRTEAQVHAMSRLEGAFERRFPAASCPDRRTGDELYHRACDGWEVVVHAGSRAGAKDSIILRGLHARKSGKP
jgi:hypothetical protein